ncbi:MAG: helix-turn-helix transcriptional regulator [Patescibacteria group bacterium]
MATLNQKFGENLRKIRKQKGLSQEELAAKAGLDLTTVNELENGNREPMLKTIVKLANGLEIDNDKLLP